MSFDGKHRDEVAGNSREAFGIPTDAELRFAERWAEAIDAYVDGSLEAAARRELERAAEADAMLREALRDARASQAITARAPKLEAPATLSDRILGAIDAQDAATASSLQRARLSPAPRAHHRRVAASWAGLAAAAAVLILVVFGPDSIVDPGPETAVYVAADGTTFSEAEVEAAAEQMELAMGFLGGTMDRTARAVTDEFSQELQDHVQDPLREGLRRSVHSIPYLQPRVGDANEHSGIEGFPPSGERPLRSRSLESAHLGERT